MAPQNNLGPRMKREQVYRPFEYGNIARPFDPVTNPKPDGIPTDHTHSWQVFIRGPDDIDITYWLRRVQFKLHESIPNNVRMVDADEPGKPFVLNETGWGEFEITMKFYFATESGEKPLTLYHFLRLHPSSKLEEGQEMTRGPNGEIICKSSEQLVFNEPYEKWYHILTEGAHPKGHPVAGSGKGGKGGKVKTKPIPPLPGPDDDVVWERSALIPRYSRPGEPFSRELEQLELKKLQDAHTKVQEMLKEMAGSIKDKEEALRKLKEENAKASGS